MHLAPNVSDDDKKKPEIIKFYNKNKFGDFVDQMLRKYSIVLVLQ